MYNKKIFFYRGKIECWVNYILKCERKLVNIELKKFILYICIYFELIFC